MNKELKIAAGIFLILITANIYFIYFLIASVFIAFPPDIETAVWIVCTLPIPHIVFFVLDLVSLWLLFDNLEKNKLVLYVFLIFLPLVIVYGIIVYFNDTTFFEIALSSDEDSFDDTPLPEIVQYLFVYVIFGASKLIYYFLFHLNKKTSIAVQ